MVGPHRTYSFNETTSIIRPRPSKSLTIDKLSPVADAGGTHVEARILLTKGFRSSGNERIVAAEAQPDFLVVNALPAEDVSTRFGSPPLSRWSMTARTCNAASSRARRNPSSIEPEPSRV